MEEARKSDLLDIEVFIHAETERAVQVSDGSERTPVWLPRSQIEIERQPRTMTAIVTLPSWLAVDKGLA